MTQKSNSINLPEINAQKNGKNQQRVSKENMPPNVFGKSNSFLLQNSTQDIRGKECKTIQSSVFGSRGVKRTVAPFG